MTTIGNTRRRSFPRLDIDNALNRRLPEAWQAAGRRLAPLRGPLSETNQLPMTPLRPLLMMASMAVFVAGASLAWLTGSGPAHDVGLGLLVSGPVALISTLYFTSVSTTDALLLATSRPPRHPSGLTTGGPGRATASQKLAADTVV